MRNSYISLVLSVAIVSAMAAHSSAQDQTQVLSGVTHCIGIQEGANTDGIALTQGETYTAKVTGNAYANPITGGEYDGVFCFYYDNSDPTHPLTTFLAKGDSLVFEAGSVNFYAFLVDKSSKDVPDNGGSMTVTLTSTGGARETLDVNGVFNCIGLEDFGAAKPILQPGRHYGVSVTGDAYTNGTVSGGYDGVLMFTRDASVDPIHPILVALDYDDTFEIMEMHATGWVYLFFVDESYSVMGNNGGKDVILFADWTSVEEETWGAIKALFE